MNPDLDRLIRLQQLETTADEARRKIADHPQRLQALDDRLAAAREALAGVKARQTEALNKRRAEEKEVSTVQARLAKYKDQLLEVKTNREYQAMLHEIETAQTDIRTREDRILESMMESDELSAEVKKAEAELKSVEKEVGAERQTIEQEVAALQAEMDRTRGPRATTRRGNRPPGARRLRAGRQEPEGRRDVGGPRTAPAPSATSGCARRSSTRSAGTIRSSSATTAAAFCFSPATRRRPLPPLRRRNRISSSAMIVAYIDGGAGGTPAPRVTACASRTSRAR